MGEDLFVVLEELLGDCFDAEGIGDAIDDFQEYGFTVERKLQQCQSFERGACWDVLVVGKRTELECRVCFCSIETEIRPDEHHLALRTWMKMIRCSRAVTESTRAIARRSARVGSCWHSIA